MDMRASEIIDRLGGTQSTADLCEISKGAVSQWRKNGIPKPREMYLRLARPEAFQDSEPMSQEAA